MLTMVFDVPAAGGGAETILREFYQKALEEANAENPWIFVVSLSMLTGSDHVKVVKYPWVKKNWLFRLWFDYVVSPKLVRKVHPDRILSLQNVLVPCTHIRQILYLHQPLPFVEKRYGLIENPRFWIYQNLISRRIYSSVQKAEKVIVQTRWMKEACIKRTGVSPDKMEVVAPRIVAHEVRQNVQSTERVRSFFYPASGFSYKNHNVLVDAIALLDAELRAKMALSLTLTGNENAHIAKLRRKIDKLGLPIQFIGTVSHAEVLDRFSRSVLVFPSYIETFGLPLLEARMSGAEVIASDCPFSHEILDGYQKAVYFPPQDAPTLAVLLQKCIEGRLFQSDKHPDTI